MNKLFLIPSAAIAALSPALVCSSCGDNPTPSPDAEKIAGYIFDPIVLEETKLQDDWWSTIMNWTDNEWEAEIFYDLFANFNFEGALWIGQDKTFKDLYENGDVGIETNIAKCEVTRDDKNTKILLDFLGYVRFRFIKDYKVGEDIVYAKNDYVMLTYELQNFKIQPLESENKFGFGYIYPLPHIIDYCLGFWDIKKVDQRFLVYVKMIDTTKFDGPTNHKNYVKNI